MYICGCIWYNTWCWTYSVNWEHMRMIFYLIRILAACKNPKNHWANKFCFNFCLFLLYLKLLSWNLHFYSVFLLLTKFLYERRWWSIFSKVRDRKPLFLLKIKIKQNPGCPNKHYNVVFKHFRQNIRAYPRSKKICIDQWLGKCCILGKIWAKRGVGKKVWFVPNAVWGSWGSCNARKILQFSPSFKLGNSISNT